MRDYGLLAQVWGESPDCSHNLPVGNAAGETYAGHKRWQHDGVSRQETPWEWSSFQRRSNDSGAGQVQQSSVGSLGREIPIAYATCRLCGAWRGNLGLEPLHDCLAWARGEPPCNACYVCHMRTVARELWRVLRNDGVFFLNLGDSYFGGGTRRGDKSDTGGKERRDSLNGAFFLRNLCDECVAVLEKLHNPGNNSYPVHEPSLLGSESSHFHRGLLIAHSKSLRSASQVSHKNAAISGSVPSLTHASEPPRASQESTLLQSSQQHPGDCHHCATCDACLDVIASANPYALVCAHTGWRLCNCGKEQRWHTSAAHNGGKHPFSSAYPYYTIPSLKPKDLVGIPWRVALALQADGWYLRSDIIWCLSGGTYVYAQTQKGNMPMMIRDMARLDPMTVKLWNGIEWVQVLGWSKTARYGNEIEIVLRSGERISCTPHHKFPTARGLVEADQLQAGDVLDAVHLPEPEVPKDSEYIGTDAAWLAGLYIAEGSRSGRTIQIAGHAKETMRWERLRVIAEKYGGSATRTVDGNNMSIRLYGKVLFSILDALVSGRTAKNKCLSPICWQYSNAFLKSLLLGYLSGDGSWDSSNNRWRLGFTRNYNLERDLRTLSARLGFKLTLKMSSASYQEKQLPNFRGEIRFLSSGHHNEHITTEIIQVRKARCRYVYDVGVAAEPHLFALASGVLTHNSKPNPMPESVRDRPTRAHEHVFLLAKQQRYYYDANAIREPGQEWEGQAGTFARIGPVSEYIIPGQTTAEHRSNRTDRVPVGRNRRTVWTIPTQPLPHSDYDKGHFATFPEALVVPMVLAGSKRGDIVLDPFAGSCTVGEVCRKLDRRFVGVDLSLRYLRELGLPRAEQQSTLESLQQLPLFAEHSEHPSSYDKTDTGREGYGAD